MSFLRRTLAATVAVAAIPALAAAQAFTGTGVSVTGGLDQRWDVSCTRLTSLMGSGICGGALNVASAFVDASVITAAPGGWASVPVTSPFGNQVRYIGAEPSGSVNAGTPDEQARFQYTFRTTFNIAAGDVPFAQLVLNPFRIDNYWVGYVLNGGALQTGGISPTPAPPTGGNWTTPFTVAINSGFQAGTNTLDIVITGNGRTDGLLLDGRVNVVPEPSTYALMATGLAGLGALVRRRRVQG